jgi:HPt (histidine-containing phosphotransfer) domain-containing protein
MWHLPDTLLELVEGGDGILVLDLIQTFQTDTASRLGRLREAVTRLDAASVKAEAHSVRGSAGQMGAEELAAVCEAVETGAPKLNWPALEAQVKQADLRFAEALIEMSDYVNGKPLAG